MTAPRPCAGSFDDVYQLAAAAGYDGRALAYRVMGRMAALAMVRTRKPYPNPGGGFMLRPENCTPEGWAKFDEVMLPYLLEMVEWELGHQPNGLPRED